MRRQAGALQIAVVTLAAALLVASALAAQAFAPWPWKRGNAPVFSASVSGWDSNAIGGPAVLQVGGQFRMYYHASGAGVHGIGLAESGDGAHWLRRTGDNPVLTPTAGAWDSAGVGAPTVIFDAGMYKMWFEASDGASTAIGLAASPDGVTWTKHSQPVLQPTASTWDQAQIGEPWVVRVASGYRMYYTGYDGATWRIGLATSGDGVVWTKHPANPVLSPRPSQWDSQEVSKPSVVFDGDLYHLWYSSGLSANNASIGYATSPDGVVWTRRPGGPVIEPSTGMAYACVAESPSALYDGLLGAWHIWFLMGCNERGVGYATTGDLPGPEATATTTALPWGTSTPERTHRVFLPLGVKDVPRPQPTATPTVTLTPTATPTYSPWSWKTLITQDFETPEGFPTYHWDLVDKDDMNWGEFVWGPKTCRPAHGSYSGWAVGWGATGGGLPCGVAYPVHVQSWLVSRYLSLSWAIEANLRFSYWLNTVPEHAELCRLVSVDMGEHFYGYCASGSSGGWVEEVWDLSNVPTLGSIVGRSNLHIAFAFISDDIAGLAEGAYVDDIALWEYSSDIRYAPEAAPRPPAATPTAARPGIIERPVMMTPPATRWESSR